RPTSLPVETIVAGGPAVGMKPLPVGTLASPARTVAASIEKAVNSLIVCCILPYSAAGEVTLGAESRGKEIQAHLLQWEEQRTEQSLLFLCISRGLSNPCSSGVLYNGGCISLGNSGNGNGSSGKRWKWDSGSSMV
nr:hypothetical protein [Tanacetum cinerariifolium]